MKIESNIVDLNCETEGSNMYGCQPCPKCGSRFRYVMQKDDFISCDDCGFKEEYTMLGEDNG